MGIVKREILIAAISAKPGIAGNHLFYLLYFT